MVIEGAIALAVDFSICADMPSGPFAFISNIYRDLSSLYIDFILSAQNVRRTFRGLAEIQFFANLNPHNSKDFWKTIKTLSKNDVLINKLAHNGMPCNSDLQKSNAFNDFFLQFF